MKSLLILIGGAVAVIALAIALSILGFVIGAFMGWLFMAVVPFFGQWIVDGMALLGLHITMADLPLFVAILGFIGSHFKSSSTK